MDTPNELKEMHDVSEEAASTVLEQLDTLFIDMSFEEALTTLQKMRDGITERMDNVIENLIYGEDTDIASEESRKRDTEGEA